MKTMLMVAVAAGAMLATTAPADARQGCGIGGHRGPYGGCRANRGPYAPGPYVVGRYYGGRGWWYGGRWWGNRYRYNGGWRYR